MVQCKRRSRSDQRMTDDNPNMTGLCHFNAALLTRTQERILSKSSMSLTPQSGHWYSKCSSPERSKCKHEVIFISLVQVNRETWVIRGLRSKHCSYAVGGICLTFSHLQIRNKLQFNPQSGPPLTPTYSLITAALLAVCVK